ncbi:hypothetical protein PCE1_004785 [Barthelona sp. PCE]
MTELAIKKAKTEEGEEVIVNTDKQEVQDVENITFEDMPLSHRAQKGISSMGFTHPTPIQTLAIPPALLGKDILGAAKTGSGKTLAFLLPALETLNAARFSARNGTGALIITPTRELALQIYSVATELCQHFTQTFGLVAGGMNINVEKEKLSKGVNLLIATPGRLIDHLRNSRDTGFKLDNLKVLILDEADHLLDPGFEEELRQVVSLLPDKHTHPRQTMLFSATQSKKISELAAETLNKETVVYVNPEQDEDAATANNLKQGFTFVEPHNRLLLLLKIITKFRRKKIMVFFSSCASVKYHYELFNYAYKDDTCNFYQLHGQMKQKRRTSTFFEFCNTDRGVLMCTNVAARGLDFPDVDWIVQYDPPADIRDYIHRVGRTARAGKAGKAIVFLMPHETGFLELLKQKNIDLVKYELNEKLPVKLGEYLKDMVSESYALSKSATDSYRSFILAYNSHSFKSIFDINALDLASISESFLLNVPPNVSLPAYNKKQQRRKRRGGPRNQRR